MELAARPDEDEARRRRSTDCIYFLASPLTCKKGSECEYRHSDAARMNPRDCWYWFSGNCVNPKCSFRHPPLDSLLGAPTTPRAAAQQSAPQVPVPAQAHGYTPASGTGTAKQGVPCYYFQKGMCAKGDKCAFLHVPQAAGNPVPQLTANVFTPALQPNPQLKNSWTKPNSSTQQNTPLGIFDKSNSSAHDGKPAQKQNLASRVDQSLRNYQNHDNSYVQSGTAKHHKSHSSVEDDLPENGMEVGEFVRERSAGSGVLVGCVDDDSEQSFKGNHNGYHHSNGEHHTGMMRQKHGSYESERSYRSSVDSLLSERRISQSEPVPANAGSSDLRHRLLKQRRLNEPRSTQVPDRHDAYLEDECHNHHHWRGEEQAAHDGVSRSRLHGRIKLPGETSFDRLGSHSEKESDRGPRARLSPPKHTDLRGKLHERLKARSNEDIPGNAKSTVAKVSGVEDAGSLNFAGPKSLAELKAKKVVASSGEDSIKSAGSSAGPARMTSEIVASRASSEPVPFQGPKPLGVILKRKREATSENAAHSGSIQEEDTVGVEESQNKFQIIESDTVDVNTEGNEEEEEAAFYPEDDVAYDDSLSPVDDNAAEDTGKELEEHQDVEAAEDCDYEAADLNAEEDNDYQEYEDDDDPEDDDDFARKVGVMIS
ncbi:zinc finger CCCH domain-containing protein 19-like isoform X2 [Phragmites australis]|uniref:zinc finger CCCH domain-containing protein 19-like isoform X2 n=1 Tax=Phragmites australis TaxID=29695 RepID=UPI002D787169|nr:zinc finger CCCH domain-containing protein 19-like isoform X2 [Phragmites australis]